MLAGFAVLTAAGAPSAGQRPRLVVGIVVDQLRTDYMEQLQDLFGQKGFRTLMRDGVYLRDVDFKASGLDASSGTAIAMTGTWPAFSGVPEAMVYDTDNRSMRPALAHPGANGSISNDSFTPAGLLVSTLTDEMAIATDGKVQIYSVAADPQQAVILAGHNADGAIWINNTTGQWATGSYYGALPGAAQRANLRNSMTHRVDTLKWRPLAATEQLYGERKRGPLFEHRFSHNDRDVFRKAALSPEGNAAVTDMAIEFIGQKSEGDQPRMLNIGYTVAPYLYSSGNGEAETTDSYLRLDTQIERLLAAVDQYCGRENAMIWLTSTGYYNASAVEDKKYRLPGGEFSSSRARSLLNSYLAARHGMGEYVTVIRKGRVYLDPKAIENRNLDPDEVAQEARQFLARMSGVEQTFTRAEILAASNPETAALNLSYDPHTGADIILRLAPGWNIREEGSNSTQKPVRQMPVMTPAIILAPTLDAGVIDTPADASVLAPTIAGILRIRSPNGARSRAMKL